jgi:hypothetical protein
VGSLTPHNLLAPTACSGIPLLTSERTQDSKNLLVMLQMSLQHLVLGNLKKPQSLIFIPFVLQHLIFPPHCGYKNSDVLWRRNASLLLIHQILSERRSLRRLEGPYSSTVMISRMRRRYLKTVERN